MDLLKPPGIIVSGAMLWYVLRIRYRWRRCDGRNYKTLLYLLNRDDFKNSLFCGKNIDWRCRMDVIKGRMNCYYFYHKELYWPQREVVRNRSSILFSFFVSVVPPASFYLQWNFETNKYTLDFIAWGIQKFSWSDGTQRFLPRMQTYLYSDTICR